MNDKNLYFWTPSHLCHPQMAGFPNPKCKVSQKWELILVVPPWLWKVPCDILKDFSLFICLLQYCIWENSLWTMKWVIDLVWKWKRVAKNARQNQIVAFWALFQHLWFSWVLSQVHSHFHSFSFCGFGILFKSKKNTWQEKGKFYSENNKTINVWV